MSLDYDLFPDANASNRSKGAALYAVNAGAQVLQRFSDEFPNLMSATAMDNYFGHYPAGSSHRQVLHFRQNLKFQRFMEFDFGAPENLRRYGRTGARDFDLQAVKGVPVALFCGKSDLLASPVNYKWLRDQLEKSGSLEFYGEYELGHCGMLMPKNRAVYHEMLFWIKQKNLEGERSNVLSYDPRKG